jgi:hypothetical protein
MTLPAVAFKSTASQAVEAMKSADSGEQLLYADKSHNTNPNTSAVVYEITVDGSGTRYLTVNHSTWHLNQYLNVVVNEATEAQNVPIYYTMGYWNESQPIPVELVKGTNTLTFTREGFAPLAAVVDGPLVSRALSAAGAAETIRSGTTLFRGVTLKAFFLYKTKPVVRPPPEDYKPKPVPDTSDYILESPSTSCVRQGIIDVPAEFCGDACTAVGNKRTYAGTKATVNVSGCFVFTEGPEVSHCYYNSNASASCANPPCTVGGIGVAELCLRK